MRNKRAFHLLPSAINALGFSLIELMIALAISAIIAAFALPAYVDYVKRGHLAEASAALALYATQLENNYLANRTYGTGGNKNCSPQPINTNQYFTFACISNTSDTFTATATSKSTLHVDTPIVYSIDQNGTRTTTIGQSTQTCWAKDVKGNCP